MSTLSALNAEPIASISSFDLTRSADAACRLVIVYADADAQRQAARLLFNMRRSLGSETPLQALWWKFSVLRDRSMSQLALDDTAQADILLFAFGSSNEAPAEILEFNRQWVRVRNNRHGLLAIQLPLDDGVAEATRMQFARLARKAGLDFISAEDDEVHVRETTHWETPSQIPSPAAEVFEPQHAAA